MDGPTSAVDADTVSASSKRLSQGGTPWGNVSRTAIQVLGPWCSTHSSISCWRSVTGDDWEGSPRDSSDALEDDDERRVDGRLRPGAFVGELPTAEVFT